VGKFIPVEPEKWAEMVKALALVKEMDKTINASQAECRRLKEKSECQAECLEAFDKENARLKAEVERLQSIHSIDSIGIEQLKEEVKRLKDSLNKLAKTPDGVDGVEVKVSFWTKSGSRLPSSYSTFWSNDKGVQS
jgi:septal ring factor EnvC (AmiA/AmiB activator)